MAEKYISVEGLKRKLIDEKNFYPVFVSSALKEMPEADVAPVVRGKWINGDECSICGGSIFDIMDVDSYYAIGFHISQLVACPWCGARMK